MLDIQEKLKEIGPYVPEDDDDLLVCRCEEVTKGEIRKAVHGGITTIEELIPSLRHGPLPGTDLRDADETACGARASRAAERN